MTGGAIFPTGRANAPPVKELKNALYWRMIANAGGAESIVIVLQRLPGGADVN